MATVTEGDFEWDDEKAAANVAKQGVSFEEAATVFADPMPCTSMMDPARIGRSSLARPCESASSTSCIWSVAHEIASSARDPQRLQSAMSTKLKAVYETLSQTSRVRG